MARALLLAPLVAADLACACGSDPGQGGGFTTSPPVTTTPDGSSGSSSGSSSGGSSSSSSSSSTSTGEDSTAGGSGTSTSGVADTGHVPDFGGQPIGCQGKIDFLFVIDSHYEMDSEQAKLNEAFPAFADIIKSDFADFDYQIMTVDASAPYMYNCVDCYMCIGCQLPGCGDFGGPLDYPCDEDLTKCDGTPGAGVTFVGNFKGSNRRCELAGGQRYITKAEGDNLAEAFKCISTLGAGPKTPLAMEKMVAAVAPEMVGKYGCNAGFLRPDALLAVVIIQGGQDNLSPGAPWSWYKTLVKAKNGNEDAVVVLVLSNDRELPDSICEAANIGDNPLRLFAEEARHGLFDSICRDSYVPFLQQGAAMILEQCSLLIPQ